MSTIKLDIQKFSGGGGNWSAGISRAAVEASLASFNNAIQAAIDAVRNYAQVDSAIQAGWSGTDRDVYLERFHEHAEDVCSQIEVYRDAVAKEAQNIISQWENFQSGLIS